MSTNTCLAFLAIDSLSDIAIDGRTPYGTLFTLSVGGHYASAAMREFIARGPDGVEHYASGLANLLAGDIKSGAFETEKKSARAYKHALDNNKPLPRLVTCASTNLYRQFTRLATEANTSHVIKRRGGSENPEFYVATRDVKPAKASAPQLAPDVSDRDGDKLTPPTAVATITPKNGLHTMKAALKFMGTDAEFVAFVVANAEAMLIGVDLSKPVTATPAAPAKRTRKPAAALKAAA